MAFLEAAGDFSELSPYDFRAELVTIDAENVLTAYGDPTIRPEAMQMIDSFERLRRPPQLVVATNNKDRDYVDAVRDQLPDSIPVLSGIEYKNKKTSPDMFLGATALFGVHPGNAIHIDDQLLSFVGARMAGFGRGVLVKPYGSNGHRGVKIGRVLDVPLRIAFRSVDAVQSFRTDGIDG